MSFFRKIFLGEWTYNLGRAREEYVYDADKGYLPIKVPTADLRKEREQIIGKMMLLADERDVYRAALEFANGHLASMENYSIVNGALYNIKEALAKYPKGEGS